jgi:hypothetical protein
MITAIDTIKKLLHKHNKKGEDFIPLSFFIYKEFLII